MKIRNVRAEAGIDPRGGSRCSSTRTILRNGKLVADQAALVATLDARGARRRRGRLRRRPRVRARRRARARGRRYRSSACWTSTRSGRGSTKELRKVDAELDARNRKLANESFLERAPRRRRREGARHPAGVPREEAAHRIHAVDPRGERSERVSLRPVDRDAVARCVAAALAEDLGARRGRHDAGRRSRIPQSPRARSSRASRWSSPGSPSREAVFRSARRGGGLHAARRRRRAGRVGSGRRHRRGPARALLAGGAHGSQLPCSA